MTDIFREIDEELRRDNLLKLWQRYGKYIIALAIALVIAAAAIVGWRQYQLQQRQAEGVRFMAAEQLAEQGKDAAAADAFAGIGREAHGGRALLARLQEAAMRAKAGDPAAAAAIYNQIAADSSVDPVFRDLATLLSARYDLDREDAKAVIERVRPLTETSNPWHGSALELTALAQLKAGDKAAARATYKVLADDLSAPAGLRARAAEMITALNS